jgi:hypothetical protein
VQWSALGDADAAGGALRLVRLGSRTLAPDGVRAARRTTPPAQTPANPGRFFFSCAKLRDDTSRCRYFKWALLVVTAGLACARAAAHARVTCSHAAPWLQGRMAAY